MPRQPEIQRPPPTQPLRLQPRTQKINPMADSAPIIIVRKKARHGGHHGGAWKVAYADFVTAMMALFIVLWLLNTSKPVREAVAGYFKDPAGTANKMGSSKVGAAEALAVTKDDMPKLKEKLEKAISQVSDLDKIKSQIEMTITPEGLRIELLETETGTFFQVGNSSPSDKGKELLSLLAHELGKLPNHLSIEGHTDSKPYASRGEYGNWELSADRANAARRLMQHNGLRPDEVSQVRGYADQVLRTPSQPLDASNRRISVIVQNLKPEPEKNDGTSAPSQSAPGKD
jgi:chemotaxis protein MotB